ncbi:MAG: Maf family protein [Ferruginibacter sp.]
MAVQQSFSITIPILAADTIVVLGDRIIGKPKGQGDAINILTALSGTATCCNNRSCHTKTR